MLWHGGRHEGKKKQILTDIFLHMVTDKVAGMGAGIVADKVAGMEFNMVTDKEVYLFGYSQVGRHGGWSRGLVNWA